MGDFLRSAKAVDGLVVHKLFVILVKLELRTQSKSTHRFISIPQLDRNTYFIPRIMPYENEEIMARVFFLLPPPPYNT